MSDSIQLTQLLKITSVAGVFVCLVLGAISAIWIILGAGYVELLVLLWGTLFLGLPMFGTLNVVLKLREYLRGIFNALSVRFKQLLKITSVAGVFVCLDVTFSQWIHRCGNRLGFGKAPVVFNALSVRWPQPAEARHSGRSTPVIQLNGPQRLLWARLGPNPKYKAMLGHTKLGICQWPPPQHEETPNGNRRQSRSLRFER